jgi:hypothetical protein
MQQKKGFIVGLGVMVLITLGVFILKAQAASLTTARVYLNRNAENLTTGVAHEIQFTPATAVSGGAGVNKVILVFPDADDGKWCATAGALVVTTTGLKDTATALPGTPTAACVKGVGAASYDTITISAVDDLSAATLYGVKLTDTGVGKLGTPANTTSGIITMKTNNNTIDIDSTNFVIDILASDQISISGVVDPTLTFSISDSSIGFGTITSAAVRYVTADLLGSATEATNGLPSTVTVSTNGTGGVVVEIKDTNANSASGLYSNAGSGKTIASAASTAVTLGNEGFGVYGKNSSNITLSEAFDNDSTADLAISTTFQTIASTAGPVSSGSFDISAKAGVSGSTPAGSYADTLTVVATGKF